MPANTHTWHAPTDHEHGDAPPAWADAFSCASFGHPVVFGGDESTPGEVAGINDAMVYVAFKGFYVPPKKGIELYVRLHIHSNPHGRSTVWHSYEVYARETNGVISFWQGWMPFGKYVTGGGTSAAFGLAGQGLKPNIAGADDASENEAWYGGNSEVIPWTWDLLVIIHDPTTYYNRGEDVNPHDMSRWEWTGDKGLRRELSQANYQMGSAKYPDRNVPQVRGWFCATSQGQITTTGSQTCAEGELPQYVMVSQTYTRGMATKTYDCPSCDVLN